MHYFLFPNAKRDADNNQGITKDAKPWENNQQGQVNTKELLSEPKPTAFKGEHDSV